MTEAMLCAPPTRSLSLGQYVSNLCQGLPLIARDDVRFKLRLRAKRDGANDRNLSLFAQECVAKTKQLTPHLTRAFPFAAVEDMQKGQVFLTHEKLMSESASRDFAYQLTGIFSDIILTMPYDSDADNTYFATLDWALQKISALLEECFIAPPWVDLSQLGKSLTQEDAEFLLECALRRCTDPNWLIRKLNSLRKRYIEHAQVTLGNVGEGKHQRHYVSGLTVERFKQTLRESQDYLRNMLAVNPDTFEAYNLKEVADRTTANPKNRRIELIVRCRGDEERAIDLGFKGVFITWTLPSKYHRNSPKWNGCTVKEAHQVLMEKWQLARAHFAKRDIPWFGLRVAEPHKDGTPHAHLFLYCSPSHLDTLVSICADIARAEDRHELHSPELEEKRFLAKPCDEKRSATAYILKYISKNINGEHMPEEDAEETALSVRAWASTWGIKQFSQSGSPPVGLWRQLRRATASDVAIDEALQRLHTHCDHSRWKGFCQDIGTARLAYEQQDNRYGEQVNRVIGFSWQSHLISTAQTHYALVPTGEFDAWKASQRGVALKEARRAVPWSTENKCNRDLHHSPQNAPSPFESELMKVTGWTQKGVQCLIRPLRRGATLTLDRHRRLSLQNGHLHVQGAKYVPPD